ncbi:hypothetical protein CSC09_2477 [Escherichia coli]|nr:hypothetical protein CSC09_2477 [Escherichia coli]
MVAKIISRYSSKKISLVVPPEIFNINCNAIENYFSFNFI